MDLKREFEMLNERYFDEALIEKSVQLAQKYAEHYQALQLTQPDVIKSVCSDENLQCTDYKTACEKCLNAFYEYKKQTVS
jgi:hypothetical protein